MSPSPESKPDERAFAAYFEPLSQSARRGCLIAIPTVTLAILIGWAMGPKETGALLLVLALTAGGVLFHRLGTRRALVLRVNDLFTRGGPIDQGIVWEDLASASNDEGTTVALTTHGGRTIPLSLASFTRDDRIQAIDAILRNLETCQHCGPLVLPPAEGLHWQTQRLHLRSLQEADRIPIQTLEQEEHLRRQQLSVDYAPEMRSELFSRHLELQQAAPGWYGFALRLDGKTIGLIQVWLEADIPARQGGIGFNLSEEFRGQGYMTEALRSLIAFAQDQTSLQSLSASCFSDNLACRRVLEKSGFRVIGEFPRFRLKNGEWKTAARYDLVLERGDPAEATST